MVLKNVNILFKKSTLLSVISFALILSFLINNINKIQLYTKINHKYVEDEFYIKENNKCNELDPIYVFSQRFKRNPFDICKSNKSQHKCFQSSKYDHYNKLYRFPFGVICLMDNFILDPSKSLQTNLTYKGPIDIINRGSPILSKGFFNMKCKDNLIHKNYSLLYKKYFNSWNYDYYEDYHEIEELAPNKTVFLLVEMRILLIYFMAFQK